MRGNIIAVFLRAHLLDLFVSDNGQSLINIHTKPCQFINKLHDKVFKHSEMLAKNTDWKLCLAINAMQLK